MEICFQAHITNSIQLTISLLYQHYVMCVIYNVISASIFRSGTGIWHFVSVYLLVCKLHFWMLTSFHIHEAGNNFLPVLSDFSIVVQMDCNLVVVAVAVVVVIVSGKVWWDPPLVQLHYIQLNIPVVIVSLRRICHSFESVETTLISTLLQSQNQDIFKPDLKFLPCSECCILTFGWFPSALISMPKVRNALCCIFLGGVSRNNNCLSIFEPNLPSCYFYFYCLTRHAKLFRFSQTLGTLMYGRFWDNSIWQQHKLWLLKNLLNLECPFVTNWNDVGN